MAGSEPATSPSSCQEAIFPWLRSLPVAPEYHPTVEEFQDPISYIFKIEKEASKYGICKIVPPVLPPPRKALARSIRAFATRSQQVGFSPRPGRPPVQRPVWQSGEEYTFREFETKAKVFEKMYLRKVSKRGAEKGASSLSPLEIETLYWKATVDKPFSVEYANDMPGSAFPLRKADCVGPTVAETEWNMRGVSRANGSLLRFMKEEIPGVTSPMVYVAMMFSWFAWHVEDHDFHSLNYLHSGAGKTWYGVPREASSAFEEVVRVHGYGGEINPLVMFAVLGEKTTVMSPEVIGGAGVPCCRLVQNPGEFVVTFPRAYHSGFSHGFNCGEAANIATPEWLTMAKDAAIRRASINYPPMVSHLQLLYDLALELCSRLPVNISSKPRSSRLKDKQKGEGETLVKDVFMKSMQRNNELLHILGKGSAVVFLPQSSLDTSSCSNLRIGSQPRVNPSHGLSSNHSLQKFSNGLVSHDSILGRSHEIDKMGGYFYMKRNFPSLYEQNGIAATNENGSISAGKLNTLSGEKSNQRLFSCVKCGILCFDCVAILQPREAAASFLMSADCSFLNDWITGSGAADDGFVAPGGDASTDLTISCTRSVERRKANFFYAPIELTQQASQSNEMTSETEAAKRTSALGLLALTYGNSSDSEEDQVGADVPTCIDEIGKMDFSSEEICYSQDSVLASLKQKECPNGLTESCSQSLAVVTSHYKAAPKGIDSIEPHIQNLYLGLHLNSEPIADSLAFSSTFWDPLPASCLTSKCSAVTEMETSGMSIQRSFEDTSRMHIFCLEHAVEVEQQLRQIGGVHMLLFCHPDYPRIEDKAKVVSKELGIVNQWNEFRFKEATKVEEEVIQIALDGEEAIPGNADWAVKLGINLFYSANLSWSPLYSKQMPYNAVMYTAFGRTSPASSPSDPCGRRSVRQKKVVAGKWCGKVWMSNQVHPFLTNQDEENAPELEREMSFRDWERPDEKSEKKPRKHPTRSGSRKIVNKKKMAADSRSIEQVKCLTTESVALYEPEDISCKLYSRTRNKKKTKYMGRRILNDLLGEKNHKQSVRSPDSNQSKSDGEDAVSDDLSEDNTHRQNSWTPGTRHANFDTVKRVSHKRRRSVSGRRTKLVEREAAVSDSSLEDSVPGGRVGRNRAKHTESQDSLSDGSLDETSHQLLGRVAMGKKEKYVEDDIASDDSLEDSSYLHDMMVSIGNKAKDIDSEDEASDDSLDRQQNGNFRGRKLANSLDREDDFSDDLVLDGASKKKKQRRVRDASEDSMDECSRKKPKALAERKGPKFLGIKDAVSDDFPGFLTYQRRRKAKISKEHLIKSEDIPLPEGHRYQQSAKTKAKSFNNDPFPDNMPLTSQQQLSRSKGKIEFLGSEEADSEDSLEDDSDQQCGRACRIKLPKSTSFLEVKRRTTKQVKIGTCKLTKETPQVFKSEKQVKQETAQLRKNRREQCSGQFDSPDEEDLEDGPNARLRKRHSKTPKQLPTRPKDNQKTRRKQYKTSAGSRAPASQKKGVIKDEDAEYECNLDGCSMSFSSKQELALHKRNVCPVKGCGKKFFSHKYLVQHRRVHSDDRPLKCPWKGCKMTFKWAWARTEHIRVHTGARPYVCAEDGCGQTFRFVSDFSRHKRKTGHSLKKASGNSSKV